MQSMNGWSDWIGGLQVTYSRQHLVVVILQTAIPDYFTLLTDVAHYNFHEDQPILIIFGRDVANRVYYQTAICYPTSPN